MYFMIKTICWGCYIFSVLYSKFRTLGNRFSWSYMRVRLWLKLKSEYRRNYRFQMRNLPRYIFLHLCHVLLIFVQLRSVTWLGRYVNNQSCIKIVLIFTTKYVALNQYFCNHLINPNIPLFFIWPVEVCISFSRSSRVPSGLWHCVQSFSGLFIEISYCFLSDSFHICLIVFLLTCP